MNDNRNTTKEPKQVSVEIRTAAGRHITLTNDGISTTRTEDGDASRTILLQSRTAFRGFVGALTELMGWSITDAWDSSSDSDQRETGDYTDSEYKY